MSDTKPTMNREGLKDRALAMAEHALRAVRTEGPEEEEAWVDFLHLAFEIASEAFGDERMAQWALSILEGRYSEKIAEWLAKLDDDEASEITVTPEVSR